MYLRGAPQRYAPYPSNGPRVRRTPGQASQTLNANESSFFLPSQQARGEDTWTYPLPGILLHGLQNCGVHSVNDLRSLPESALQQVRPEPSL